MKKIVYSPQPKATADEVMQVLKMFTFSTLSPEMKTGENLMKLYETLPPKAQRHFKIEEK